MNDISADDAELIIEAAASGSTVPGHEGIGEMLTSLHAPAEATGREPSVAGVDNGGVVARLTRRTAVAASAAVLGVAGVAAAATGGAELLDPVFGVDEPVVVIEEADEEPDESADVDADTPDAEVDIEVVAEGDGDGDKGHGNDEPIDEVDPSDGLNDDELELVCAAAENHGAYVSAVARDRITETDGTHGERVGEAAHRSDCGKDDDAAGETEGDEEEFASRDGDGDEDEDEADADKPGNGNGNGDGHGNGNGNGNGRGHAKHGE